MKNDRLSYFTLLLLAYLVSILKAKDLNYITWESNRSGRWDIWLYEFNSGNTFNLTKNLLSPSFCCPTVSPDGKNLVFIALSTKQTGYDKSSEGEIVIYNLITKKITRTGLNATTYGENRFATWKDNKTLVYIGIDGKVNVLKIQQPGKIYSYTLENIIERNVLVSPLVDFITTEFPNFHKIGQRGYRFFGCQPNFDYSGKVGYWTAGTGGPIKAIYLETGDIKTVLPKKSIFLPPKFDTIYFPHISPDLKTLAIGASRGELDHFRSDYEIFILPLDNLEVAGYAKRITKHPATDRYPNVFLQTSEKIVKKSNSIPKKAYKINSRSLIFFHRLAEDLDPEAIIKGKKFLITDKDYSIKLKYDYTFPIIPGKYFISWSPLYKRIKFDKEINSVCLEIPEPIGIDIGSIKQLISFTKKFNSLTLQLYFKLSSFDTVGAILALSGGIRSKSRFLVIYQKGKSLLVHSTLNGGNVSLYMPIKKAENFLILHIQPIKGYLFLNGSLKTFSIPGDFHTWKPRPLYIGKEEKDGKVWSGKICLISFYPYEIEKDLTGIKYRFEVAKIKEFIR